VAGHCEHSNKTFVFQNCVEFLDLLKNCKFLKNDSSQNSYIVSRPHNNVRGKQDVNLPWMYTHTHKVKDKFCPRIGHEGPEVKLYTFFNLGARWRMVVNATPRPLYPG
jgi:hypothetical protein